MSESARRHETLQFLARPRARHAPSEQGVFEAGQPSPFHDVLVIGPRDAQDSGEFYRLPVVKVPKPRPGGPERQGAYLDPPERLDLYDYSARRTLAFARPQDWVATPDHTLGDRRGPAFGTLPVKREPAATACLTCYLVDAQNFTHVNAWTAEEWSDLGTDDLPAAATADDVDFEIFVAGPRGQVFHLHVVLEGADGSSKWQPGGAPVTLPNGAGSLECLDLRHEMEIWNQLRNGVVAGSVDGARKKRRSDGTTIPLVNITSLIPDPGTGLQSPASGERQAMGEGGET